MKSAVEFCVLSLMTGISLSLLIPTVAAQEGPGIVIARPGQDVELLCTVTVTDSGSQTAAWLINNKGPYRVNSLRGGSLAGHRGEQETDPDSNNIIVKNITMNDERNGSDYRCVIVPAHGTFTLADIMEESKPTILYVAGVPAMVPGVTVDNNTIIINGNNVNLTLSWGEPFNNLDPIMNYTVSCSGDDACPPNFTTTDNTARSYTITNLIPMTNYTFSVVATNSIGSGEAGVVMIATPGEVIPGVPAMVPDVTVDDNTINVNGNNVTLTLSWGKPFDNLDPIVNYTVSCSGDDACPRSFTTTDSTTRSYNITNLTPITSYTFSVVATNSIGSGEAGVVRITTPGVPAMVPNVTVDGNTININGNNVTLTLSWGEPFNNLDPIVNYTVSCSGDDACSQSFTTTDSTRSYTITNLTPMTHYTFSVVATNSIGSGEAGVVRITTPGAPAMVPGVSVDSNSTKLNVNGNNVTLTLSWGEPFNYLNSIANYTVSCSGDDTCPPNFTTTDNTTRSHTITNLTSMTNYTFSVVAANSIGSGKAGVVMITTPGTPAVVPGVTVDYNTISVNGNNVTLTLSWGEPFNYLNSIVNYTVSCSGDNACPPNFTTTDNTTRSYTVTNLSLMTNYTFSVVATNSIGSGEAGVVIITPGVPAMVPGVTVDGNTINTNGNSVTLTLSWGEPFNNLDPIMSYTVSCSGDDTCPPNFTTTDSTTKSYTITNLTPMTNYTFSVVATNSIGSGEAGVVMITVPDTMSITTTSTVESMSSSTLISFITSTLGMDMNLSTTTSVDVNTSTPIMNMSTATSTVSISSITSSMDMALSKSHIYIIASTSNVAISTTNTSTMNMNSTKSTESMSPTPSTTNATSSENTDSTSDSTVLIIILIIIIVMILLCCCSFCILFCCCCARKEWHYPNEKLCNDPRNSFGTLVILGVLTFGISLLIWYIHLKRQSNDADKDKYCKITHVSIFVLGIYTCGTSVLLWWLYKGITEICGTKKKLSLKDKSAIPLSSDEVKALKISRNDEVPSVTNQLAKDQEFDQLTTNFNVPDDEQPTSSVINENYIRSVVNDNYYDDEKFPLGYAVVDTKNVIAYHKAVASAQQNAAENQSTGQYASPKETVDKNKEHEDTGVGSAQPSSILHENTGPYAVPNVTANKDQGDTGVASAQPSSILLENTGPYAVPSLTADKDQMGAGVTSKHQSSIKYQNTGPYALPSQTFDSNTNQKDQGALSATNTQQRSAQYQNVGPNVLPSETADNTEDQGTDQGAMGVTNAQQSSAQDQNTEPFALSNETDDKDRKTNYAELDELPSSGMIRTTANDTYTPYAEIC